MQVEMLKLAFALLWMVVNASIPSLSLAGGILGTIILEAECRATRSILRDSLQSFLSSLPMYQRSNP